MSKGWLASLPIVNIDMMSRIKYSRNAKVHSYEARCKLRPITSHTFITMLKKTPLEEHLHAVLVSPLIVDH